MTLKGILTSLGEIAINDKLCNWAGCGSSIYQVNPETVKDYPFVFFSPTGTHRVEDNYTTYSITAFYVGRLLDDNSNDIDIQSTAIEVLKNLIRKAEKIDGVVGVAIEYIANVFVEYEKFVDRCTGAYIQCDISILNDTTCAVDEQHYFVFNNEPGEVLPANSTGYTISWLTDYPSISYTLVLPNGQIVNGYTEEHSVLVTFPENTERTDQKLTFIAFADGEGEVGRLDFYQESIDFFEFVTVDNQTIPANSTAFNVAWATNIPGEREYVVTKNGEPYSSGVTEDNDTTVRFPANHWRDLRYGFEISVSIGGNYMGTLNFTQDKIMFTLLAGKNVVMAATDTSCTVTWETTLEKVNYRFEDVDTYETLAEGSTTGNSLTFTFPPNEDTESYKFYEVYFSSDWEPINENAEWRQAPAQAQPEYYFNFVTAQGQVLSADTTATTVAWDTNYGTVRYHLFDENRLVVSGNTSDSAVTLTFPANANAERKQYTFEVRTETGSLFLGSLYWYQEALPVPVYYFNILTEPGQTIPATATTFRIEYETNIQPPFHWVYYSPFGTYEGDSYSQSSLLIGFHENESTSVRERIVEIGGESISWYQEGVEYEFNFINAEGVTFPASTTANTVSWETNYDSIEYRLMNGGTLITSGETTESSVNVEFPENTSTALTITFSFRVYNNGQLIDTLHWSQAPKVDEYMNTGITTDLLVGPEIKEASEITPYGYYALKWEEGDEYFVNGYTGTDQNYEAQYYVFGDMHVENGVVPLPYSQKIRIFQAIPVEDIIEMSGQTLYYYNASGSSVWDRAVVYTGAAYCMRDLLTGKYVYFNTAGFTRWTYDPKESVFYDRLCANMQADGNGVKVCIATANSWNEWSIPPAIGSIYGFDNVLRGRIRYGNPAYPPSGFNSYADWNKVRCGWHVLTEVEY